MKWFMFPPALPYLALNTSMFPTKKLKNQMRSLFFGGAEMVDFSGDLTKEPVKIQVKASPQKKVFNIQKEAKKKIAKKLIVPKIINVAEINSTKQDTFFYSNGVNKSFACSTVSQYSAKKAILNYFSDAISSCKYQDTFFIHFHKDFLVAEVNNTSAFIRPPPAFLDAFTSRSI